MPRMIALDIGERRIGVAISDETQTIATAFETITAHNTRETIGRIEAITKEYNAEKIIIGLPLNMDGSAGEAAKRVINFTDILKKSLSIDVLTFDERLTTKQAEALLLEADMSRRKRKKNLDKIAAQIILQGYLDYKSR